MSMCAVAAIIVMPADCCIFRRLVAMAFAVTRSKVLQNSSNTNTDFGLPFNVMME
jgi:hypothetical protein